MQVQSIINLVLDQNAAFLKTHASTSLLSWLAPRRAGVCLRKSLSQQRSAHSPSTRTGPLVQIARSPTSAAAMAMRIVVTPQRWNRTTACLHAPGTEVQSKHQPDSPRLAGGFAKSVPTLTCASACIILAIATYFGPVSMASYACGSKRQASGHLAYCSSRALALWLVFLLPVSFIQRLMRTSRVAQWLACWAHNPKVRGSKPRSAKGKE